MTAASRRAAPRTDHAGRTAAHEAPGLLGAAVRLVFWVAVALLASIVVEWIGMTWWWPDEGVAHSRSMLETEIGYLSGDLRRSAMVADTAAYARRFADTGHEWIWVHTGLERGARWMASTPQPDASVLQTELHGLYAGLSDYVVAAATITQVFAVRVAILSLCMPAFVLAGLMGLLDGAVQRDLRRWGGGRESSFVYHHARRLILPAFILAWVVYLSLPFSLHPAAIVLPFAASMGLLIAVTASSFKKYL